MNASERHDERIETLAGDLARALRDAPPEDRTALRDYASEIVRNSADEPPERHAPRRDTRRGATFAAGMLLAIFGLGFMLLVPTVGGAIAAIGFAAMLVGVLGALFSARRSARAPSSSSGSGRRTIFGSGVASEPHVRAGRGGDAQSDAAQTVGERAEPG